MLTVGAFYLVFMPTEEENPAEEINVKLDVHMSPCLNHMNHVRNVHHAAQSILLITSHEDTIKMNGHGHVFHQRSMGCKGHVQKLLKESTS